MAGLRVNLTAQRLLLGLAFGLAAGLSACQPAEPEPTPAPAVTDPVINDADLILPPEEADVPPPTGTGETAGAIPPPDA